MNELKETDWQEGKPPCRIEVDAVIDGNVRRGWNAGSDFVLVDCTHPMQNMVARTCDVESWRCRDSVRVIENASPYNSMQNAYSSSAYGQSMPAMGLSNIWEAAVAHILPGWL